MAKKKEFRLKRLDEMISYIPHYDSNEFSGTYMSPVVKKWSHDYRQRIFKRNILIIVLLVLLSITFIDLQITRSKLRKATKENNSISTELKDLQDFKNNAENLSNTVTSLVNSVIDLDVQNKQLVESNESMSNELSVLRERAEIYDQYAYALAPSTDIDMDQMIYLEDLLDRYDIEETDLILAWILTESSGHSDAQNAVSSAKGYGQFLDSTSYYIWCDILGYPEESWSPELALDAYHNLELMVTYVDLLYDRYEGNLYDMILEYRGLYDQDYLDKINEFMFRIDNGSLSAAAFSMQSRYNSTH
jgi:hypothetical protein